MPNIDYSKRAKGQSKREYEAEATGGTLNYDTGEITGGSAPTAKPNIYSGQNVLNAVASPVSKPDYSAVENINASLQKSLEALNKYDLNQDKIQADIEKGGQHGLTLGVIGGQASEAARIGAIGRTGYANIVSAKTNALNAAKEAYNTYMTQANADREYSQSDTTTDANDFYAQATTLRNTGKSWGEIASELGKRYDLTPGSDYSNQLDSIMTGKPVGSTVASADQWADMLAKGQATISNVPTDIRDAVIQKVSELGTGVNKQLSDTALNEISQSKAALTALDDLQSKITDNQDKIGPITGLEALNPWSEKRKIQADVDRVRQVVGKALEGGVLRKEDEEKYKKILTTITDAPETALYKIEALKSDIQRKIEEYMSLQQGAGRYVGGIQSGNTDDLRIKYKY